MYFSNICQEIYPLFCLYKYLFRQRNYCHFSYSNCRKRKMNILKSTYKNMRGYLEEDIEFSYISGY